MTQEQIRTPAVPARTTHSAPVVPAPRRPVERIVIEGRVVPQTRRMVWTVPGLAPVPWRMAWVYLGGCVAVGLGGLALSGLVSALLRVLATVVAGILGVSVLVAVAVSMLHPSWCSCSKCGHRH